MVHMVRQLIRFSHLLDLYDCMCASDKFLDQQYSLDYCIARLLDSAFVTSHHDEVSTCILDLLGRVRCCIW